MRGEELLKGYKEGRISTNELRDKLEEMKKQSFEKQLLSEGQKGLWMLDKISPGMCAYNLPICFRIREEVDMELFEQAFQFCFIKYPILKTVIEEENNIPYQYIRQTQSFSLHVEDLSGLSEEEITVFIRKIARESFSLNEGPLIRGYAFTGKEETIILINVHHIIFDGVSSEILVDTLLNAYIDLENGKKLEAGEAIGSYYEFVDWEKEMLKSPRGEEHRAYWREQLSGTLPVLELPTDYKRSRTNSFKGESYHTIIKPEQKEKIQAFCKIQQVSMPTMFLAVFNLMLYQYSNQKDILVGMASLGRPFRKFEDVIGYFINMLPIRSILRGEGSFLQYLKELQITMLDAMDHSDYPFPVMVKDLELPRNQLYSPVFQVGFIYQNFIRTGSMPEKKQGTGALSIEFLDEVHQAGEYELTLEILEKDNNILIKMKYNPDLYSAATICRMTGHFMNLMQEVLCHPDLRMNNYPAISKEDEKTMLLDWNATKRDYGTAKCVHELFEKQARKTPDAIAAVFENETLTYCELDSRSTKLAVYLQKQGVTQDSLVGIGIERSLYMIVGLLGILKAGGAYVPFDPEYPKERMAYMMDNSGVTIVLTQSSLKDKMEALSGEQAKVIILDKEWDMIDRIDERQETLTKDVKPNHLAYVLYTSGSTGNPKGVMIPHSALTNFLLSMGEEPGMTAQDKLLAVTTYCFDIAGLELYLPLIKGAQCFICSTEKQKNIELLRQEIRRVRPTIMQATPATWMALFLIGWKNEEKIKVLCGGEALPEKLKQHFMETDTQVWNMFGPTETTIWSTVKRIHEEDSITIGKPIANTQIYILDQHHKPVPMLVPGELYIGGAGLARGYLHLPKLTEERFIDNPICTGTKLYRTGDLARWLPDGDIEFLGRIDNQVKMHGYRIELDEIEMRINQYPGIRENAVVIHAQNENRQLRAFYVCKEGHKVDIKELRIYLKKWLPAYMIPSVFTELSAIPLTPNGKVNRRDLSECDVASFAREETNSSRTSIEAAITEIWKEVIGITEVGMDDNFFDVGGDSVTAVIAVERIGQKFSCDLKVTSIFEYSSIKMLSRYIEELKKQDEKEPDEHLQKVSQKMIHAGQKNAEQFCNCLEYYSDSLAIIGISCQFPDAVDYQQFWQNLKEGKESIKRLSINELQQLGIPKEIIENPNYVPVQSTIDGKEEFDPEFFRISPKDAESMDPQMRLLLQHSWKAIEDAGYRVEDISNTAVYMSASSNAYQVRDENSDVRLIEESDQYVNWLLGQGGTVPTMISYHLGLKGPSYSVHSNCSSSLTGLYAAYQSLCSGETEYALVGASTIHSLVNAGYVHLPGLNFSSDGHIKAFDETADGMVGGEGVGVILLKKAEKAIEDGDHIYSILRGIGINNDGAEKVGFYAPSIKGQKEVIQKVLDKTGIAPETIDYIEAHGTGTKLGDPIEVQALHSIFRKYTSKNHFCGIGSVKTNIGHLDTASGIAGCIKVALSLYHRQLPPTLNFKKVNPEINLEESPFYVVTKACDLSSKTAPCRAALSSFGIGGTNVHAIFESCPKRNTKSGGVEKDSGDFKLIPVSAKNEERLQEYVSRLLAYLKSDSDDIDLESFAYTLQTGREMMDSRVVFLTKNKEELILKMEAFGTGKANIENCFQGKMGQSRELLPLFEQDEDTKELIRKWLEKRRMDKLALLWVQGARLDWNLLYREGNKPYRISLPTYPFAKIRYWKEKAKKEANTIISVKGAENLHPFIGRNTSDFKEQKYATTFLGTEFFLADHCINQKKVLPGVAYIEMARAAGELATNQKVQKLKNIIWSRPVTVEQIREVGIVLSPHEHEIEFKVYTMEGEQRVIHSQGKLETGGDLAVFANQKEKIDIADCIKRCSGYISHNEFYEGRNSNVYQYGTTFRPIREIHCNGTEAISLIELPKEREDDFYQFTLHPSILEGCLQTVAGLLGADHPPFMPFSIDEIEIMEPFSKKCFVYASRADQEEGHVKTEKFHIKLLDTQGKILAEIQNYSIRAISSHIETADIGAEGLSTLYYYNNWEKADVSIPETVFTGTTLIFSNGTEAFSQPAGQFYHIRAGEKFQESGNSFEINPGEQKDYILLFQALKQKRSIPMRIVYMWSFDPEENGIDLQMERNVYSLFYLVKALMEKFANEKIKILILFQEKSGIALALNQAISGFAKTVAIENPNYFLKTIQCSSECRALEDILRSEFQAEDANEIRYTQEGRFIRKAAEEIIDNRIQPYPMPFRSNGVYVITGGMGGLGLKIAAYLAREVKARLVLTGRKPLDDGKRDILSKLEELGAQVIYIQADVSEREETEAMVKQVRAQFQNIHGIIHCAGIIEDKLLRNKSYEEIKAVLSPKVKGTISLDEATREEALDFFLLFSSVSSSGNLGQSDYAYANSFLNTYAQYRETLAAGGQRMGKTVSISWPLWEEGGMQMTKEAIDQMKSGRGIYPISTKEGIRALEAALVQKHSQITVYYGKADKIRQTLQEINHKVSQEKNVIKTAGAKADEKLLFEKVKDFLTVTASALLKIKTVDIDKDMIDYGFDSISNTEFTNKINEQYQLEVMPTIFFELEQQTIRALANTLCRKYADKLSVFYSMHTGKVEIPENVDLQSVPKTGRREWETKPDYAMHSRFAEQELFNNSPEKIAGQDEPVAIIGMNGIFPQSENLEEFWENLVGEKNLVTEIPKDRFDWREYKDPRVRWGGFMKEVDKFDASFFGISEREAEVMDPQHRLFLQVAWNTMEDAGYKPADLYGSDTGIFVGIGTQDYSRLLDDSLSEPNPYALTGRTPFMLVNRISSMLNLHGPSEPIDTACSSSLVAVHKAVREIQAGTCSMAIAGGVNVILNPSVHLAFSAAGMLTDSGACKVFDKEASGTIRSEGVGAVLLKKLSDAIEDNDHIYALIRSSAEKHKGKSASLTAPNANAEAELITEVYHKANIDPTTINYIETHSTGTKLGDPIEINGLKNAFEELYKKNHITEVKPHCAISSLKSNIGHLEAAAGIGAMIKVLLSLKHETLLSTLHFRELNPYISLDNSPFYINTQIKPWKRIAENVPRRAGISAFGFGGVNVHVLVEEYMDHAEKKPADSAAVEAPVMIVLSAKNEERLKEQARLLYRAFETGQLQNQEITSIAYTLQVGREALAERLAFTAASVEETEEKLLDFMQNPDSRKVYRGQAKRKKDTSDWLLEDEEILTIVEAWKKKGEYQKLLNLWVRGGYIDWNKLYEDKRPKRISLPVYPFEKKRYWLKDTVADLSHTEAEEAKKSLMAEERILNILSSLLNIKPEQIDRNEPLEELGLDSILLTQLLQRLQSFHFAIDFEVLYHCKTVDEIISVAAKPEEEIVKIQEETPLNLEFPELVCLNRKYRDKPVFWLHGGFGGVEVYRFIAQNIQRPFYGIQAKGYMSDEEPIQGIEAMAEYYVRIILSVQPEGPYDLGGLSLGGMIAYEVARQLQEQGQKINSLIMLESIYVNEKMRRDWIEMPGENLKKDRMFRAANLLLAFSSKDEMALIPDSDLNLEINNEAFLDQLVLSAKQKGITKSEGQLKKSIQQLEKILSSLDISTALYEAKHMADPEGVPCFYFCNTSGTLFGEDESYFRLVEKGRMYDYRDYAANWKEKLPDIHVLKLEASSHLTLLTEKGPQEVITDFCKKLYQGEEITEEYLNSLSIDS